MEKASTAIEIADKLREAEIPVSQRDSVGEASRKVGVTERTHFRQRKECATAVSERRDAWTS
jgi:hypothetical protein